MSNVIQAYYLLVNDITNSFLEKYFTTDADYWWVGDVIGEALHINDHWLQWSEILFCIENNIIKSKFFKCYQEFEAQMDDNTPKRLIHFLRLSI